MDAGLIAEKRAAIERGIVTAMQDACEAPMVWGGDDCTLWPANILRSVLGYDPAHEHRGAYGSRAEASLLMGEGGLLKIMRDAADRFGWRSIGAADALPGDVGLALVPSTTVIDAVALGDSPMPRTIRKMTLATMICRAPGWFVGRNETGVSGLKASRVERCWSVL